MFSALLLLLFLLMLEYLMHDEVAGVPAAMTIFLRKRVSSVVRVQEEQSSGLCFLIRPKSQSIVGLQQSRT